MKKLLYCLISLIFFSCSSSWINKPEYTLIYGLDFTKYMQKGFLFTSDKYNGKYEGMGIFSFEWNPEIKIINISQIGQGKIKVAFTKDFEQLSFTKIAKADYFQIESFFVHHPEMLVQQLPHKAFSKLLDECYNFCIQIGADAFVNLSTTTESSWWPAESSINRVPYRTFKVTGFAIKRK